MKKPNTITKEQMLPCKDLPKGEFVKRRPDFQKVWIKGDYNRTTKTYSLIDTDDTNHEIFVKGSTLLFVGFTY